MKTFTIKHRSGGYVSLVAVLGTGAFLTLLMVFAYSRALTSQKVQTQVQLNVDYAEKEEAILRAIVAITPNRAIRAMQTGSNLNDASRNPLRWQNIFTEALDLANARQSVSNDLVATAGGAAAIRANSGDGALANPERIFRPVVAGRPLNEYVSAGIDRSLGGVYPPPLNSSDANTDARDILYPIISAAKTYGALANGQLGTNGLPTADYPNYNRLTYPNINFGYARPGDPFVAKRNWWAFSLDVADHDDDLTLISRSRRDFVLSLYEIPSQLAISAASFMALGEDSNGDAWGQKITISGGVFAGQATVEDNTALAGLASRRGMTISNSSTIGGRSFSGNPFAAGIREQSLMEGTFFPVSLASESGRAAFVPISRGAEYFDRFAHAAETNVLSTTSWNNYSVGALQCAMQLDVVQVQSTTNRTPRLLRFGFSRNGARQTTSIPLDEGVFNLPAIPAGYVQVAIENNSFNFGTRVVDVAYGAPGGYTFRSSRTGNIRFDNATFGDPLVGTGKFGYWRERAPAERLALPSGQYAFQIYPERMRNFVVTAIGSGGVGGDPLAITPAQVASGMRANNSLVVNVDYSNTGLSDVGYRPSIPSNPTLDYAVILKECDDLSSFAGTAQAITKGFSLVTNMRLYIADDFNLEPGTPFGTYVPAGGQPYYPPCSLFSPEKRYGVEINPFAVEHTGQVGSLASGDKVNAGDANPTMIRPLESRLGVNGTLIDPGQLTINLRPITHPADLPPIFMTNWLVLLEERSQF